MLRILMKLELKKLERKPKRCSRLVADAEGFAMFTAQMEKELARLKVSHLLLLY